MPTATESIKMQGFDAPRTTSVDTPLGRAYLIQPHKFSYSPTLVNTGANYDDSLILLAAMIERGEFPADARFSTAAEERAVERFYESQGIDPRKAEAFKDNMGSGKSGYVWGHTLTGLRVPNGWEDGRRDTGTGKYPRQVIQTNPVKALQALRQGVTWEAIGDSVNDVIGEVQVPQGGGLVIVEWDEVFGVASEVRDMQWPHEGFSTHWYFKPNPKLDNISNHYDVAVGRRGGWLHAGHEGCLDVGAGYVRRDAGSLMELGGALSDGGFRPVRGPLPEIESVSSNADVEAAKRAVSAETAERFARDIRTLTLPQLLEKYRV